MKKFLIIDQIIEGGAIKLYAQLLSKAIKRNLRDNELNFQNQIIFDDIKPKKSFLRELLFKIKPVYNFLKKFYTNYRIYKFTKEIEKLDNSTILVVPYIIQNSNKYLDKMYEAISKKILVLVIHDLHIYHYPEQWDSSIKESVYKRYNLLVNKAKKIIVHNNFTKNDVCEKLNVSSKKINVVKLPPFLDATSVTIDRTKLNSKFPIENIEYGIWASSSTSLHKNHERLIKAWRVIIDRGFEIKLIFTGHTSPRWEEISELINMLDLENYIFFTGVVTNSEVSSLISNAKFSICPTLFAGGGPVPAAESIVMGVPLLISDIQECRELLDDRKDNAYFFDPLDENDIANSIIELLTDYENAVKKAKMAQETYLQSRNWDKSSLEYIRLIKSLI
jgi:glycosyltransferase involved in cell wall biosynthesis